MKPDLRRIARTILLPTVGMCVIAYFIYHTIQGRYGVLSHVVLSSELRAATETMGTLHARRIRIERRVALLKPPNVDRDMLEETALRQINFADPGAMVLLLPRGPTPGAGP